MTSYPPIWLSLDTSMYVPKAMDDDDGSYLVGRGRGRYTEPGTPPRRDHSECTRLETASQSSDRQGDAHRSRAGQHVRGRCVPTRRDLGTHRACLGASERTQSKERGCAGSVPRAGSGPSRCRVPVVAYAGLCRSGIDVRRTALIGRYRIGAMRLLAERLLA